MMIIMGIVGVILAIVVIGKILVMLSLPSMIFLVVVILLSAYENVIFEKKNEIYR